ncbi:MAG TPA: gluconate 2-dehydrogenase subunit 3 family protein [Steroidobacteraceae bacterium]|nr:gluconate 2-dehydrogenase subunit 3 family protein [Steroidobacteraceae bacterium]
MADISRRALLKAAGVMGVAALPQAITPARPASASAQPATYLFLNSEEASFLEAAVSRLIPDDDEWPGALQAGVANYIDKQLAGAWGAGERLYRSGPWRPGTASQGYQLPFTPAELFRASIGAINKALSQAGTPFARMSAEQQDAYLARLETGDKDLGGVPSGVFFEHLWESTIEGFFSDPVYGGNRDMVAWRMIGFPGAYASYYDLIDQHGIKIDRAPTSIGEGPHGGMHMNPSIPAKLP